MAASATGISDRAQLRGRPVAHRARDVDRHQAFRGCRPVARGAFCQLRGRRDRAASSSVPGISSSLDRRVKIVNIDVRRVSPACNAVSMPSRICCSRAARLITYSDQSGLSPAVEWRGRRRGRLQRRRRCREDAGRPPSAGDTDRGWRTAVPGFTAAAGLISGRRIVTGTGRRERMRPPARAAHRFRRDRLTQGGRGPLQSPELGLHEPGQPPPARLRCGASVHEMLLTPGCSRLITDAPVTRVWSNILTLPREHSCRQDPGRPIKVRYTRSAPPNAAERW
jgi:hypothetical protein